MIETDTELTFRSSGISRIEDRPTPALESSAMKLLALLALLVAGCGSSPSPPDGGGGAGGSGGTGGAGGSGGMDAAAGSSADAGYPMCPQYRVEGPECTSTTSPDGVSHKDGHICATCMGLDSNRQPTAQPVGCTTVASGGADLCVADCGECS
jgi:hypothetical protein